MYCQASGSGPVTSSAPVSAEEKCTIIERINPNLYDNYAMSGVGLISCLMPADCLEKPGSVGQVSSLLEGQVVDWQNGPDAVRLFDGDTVVDALQYGDAGMFNAGEGMFAADVTGDISLTRDLFGTDTNNNAVDFSAGAPMPGIGPAVVPVPTAAWLFGSGLALLGMRRRRGRREHLQEPLLRLLFQRRQRIVFPHVDAEA
ncbi:MAG: hypothetical protein CL799_09710 [Chromatiales bacterium]|jgi:hypothetical protein|nr:hypothetical protein [Chromatiales bacterium]